MRIVTLGLCLASTLVLGIAAQSAEAQPVADFYRGKTIKVLIGYGPGGGYDIYGRLAAEFLGRFIPGNPTIIAENMPGNASLRVVDYLVNVAPKDGTHLGSVQQALAMTAKTDDSVKVDVGSVPYIGRFTSNIDIAVALPRAGIKSFEEAKRREIVVGTDQTASMGSAFARILNAYGGAKIKLVKGYSGSAEVQLAAERGEVEAIGSYSLPAVLVSHPDWVKQGTATILYQNALKRFPELPQVPTVLDLTQGEEGKSIARVVAGTAEIGRSILATPGLPPERLQALRAAFQAMLKDAEFLAIAEKRNLMIDPARGEEMDAINRETLAMAPATIAALKNVLRD